MKYARGAWKMFRIGGSRIMSGSAKRLYRKPSTSYENENMFVSSALLETGI
jgi:hypothetical protein